MAKKKKQTQDKHIRVVAKPTQPRHIRRNSLRARVEKALTVVELKAALLAMLKELR